MLPFNCDPTDPNSVVLQTSLYEFIRETHVVDFDILSSGFGENFYMVFPNIWEIVDPTFQKFLKDMASCEGFAHALSTSVNLYNHYLARARLRYDEVRESMGANYIQQPDWRRIMQDTTFSWKMTRDDAMLLKLIFVD